MDWTPEIARDLDTAFEASSVCGIAYDEGIGEARVYMENKWLLADGHLDPDERRVVVLGGVTTVEVRYSVATDPVLPVASLDEVEALFAAARWSWSDLSQFFDAEHPDPLDRREPSLRLGPGPYRRGHSLDWCVEFGFDKDPPPRHLDGTIYFDGDVWAERADGCVLTVEQFTADAVRWWDAFAAKDRRVNSLAQRAASRWSPRWRAAGGGPLLTGSPRR